MVKTDEERTKTIMYGALQIASALATLSEPFLPFTSNKLKEILKFSAEERNLNEGELSQWNKITTREALLPSGHIIGKAELLFAKIEDEKIEVQLQKLEASKVANAKASESVEPQKDTATFEDFTKMDLRVGTILEASKMPKTKKLMVLKVETGLDKRTIVSGIAEHFKAEELIGKKVTVLANLAPRKLRGVESEGMILLTENAEGKLVFVNPDEDGVINGATIN